MPNVSVNKTAKTVVFKPAHKLSNRARADISAAGGKLYASAVTLNFDRIDLKSCYRDGAEIPPSRQWNSLYTALSDPGWFNGFQLFALGSEVYSPNAQSLLNAFIYVGYGLSKSNVKWISLSGSAKGNHLRDTPSDLSMVIVDNIHPSMTDYKLTALFDILHVYANRGTPVVLSILGMDPIDYCKGTLKYSPTGGVYLADPKTVKQRADVAEKTRPSVKEI